MKNSYFRRGGALLLSVMLCMVFTLATPQEASAAQTKTFYVPTKYTETWNYTRVSNDSNGNQKDSSVKTITQKCDKNGLGTSFEDKTGKRSSKQVCKRNTSGDITETTFYENNKKSMRMVNTYDKSGNLSKVTYYDKSGKVVSSTRYVYLKNGDVSKETQYNKSGKLLSSTSYEYWKKGVVKKEYFKDKTSGNTNTYVYDKNGNVTSYVFKEGKNKEKNTYKHTLDKKGNPEKTVRTTTFYYNGEIMMKEKATTVTNYTYDKKGRVTREVWTTKGSRLEGSDNISLEETGTRTLKLNSKGDRTKETYSMVHEDSKGGKTSESSSYTRNYKKYKKVKVAKKYWKFFNRKSKTYWNLCVSGTDGSR